ncbi:MAG: ATP-binding cassette domain-containing protein [Schleiferiaceae bacterium]|nr:ATP-binding cassette domain-containing protein [Schleiferiaceae bacterium]
MPVVIRSSPLRIHLDRNRFLDFPELEVHAGEMLLIQGTSGAGKSTWMHALAGMIPLSSGQIEIPGHGTLRAGQSVPKSWRRHAVSVLPQRAFFWNSLSLGENLSLAAWAKGLDSADVDLDRLGLSEQAAQSAHSLSMGEQQRVSALRAFLSSSPVLLADEPTASLDDANATNMMKLLRAQQAKQDCGIILASHDQRVLPYADRLILLP